MSKHKVILTGSSFKKLMKAISKIEKTNANLTIDGMPVSNFVRANSILDDAKDTPEIRTKRRILHIAGNFSTKPEAFGDDIDLVHNLLYGDNEYTLLQMSLDSLAKEYKSAASISNTEMTDCGTVGDCTALVNSKIK